MLTQFNCPNCGASLPYPAVASDLVTCQYCNTTFRVPKTSTPQPDMGDLILGADFSKKPVAGWGFPNEDKISLIQSNPPELRAKFNPSDTFFYVLNTTGYFDDIDASVSFMFSDGNVEYIRAGLILRYQKNVGSYGFIVSAQGTYMVGYYEKGSGEGLEWKVILDWTKHAALRSGLNQSNRLRVVAEGDRLRVYLNGVLATSLRDNRYESGEVILAVEPSNKSSVDVSFYDLQLRDVRI